MYNIEVWYDLFQCLHHTSSEAVWLSKDDVKLVFFLDCQKFLLNFCKELFLKVFMRSVFDYVFYEHR